MSLSLTTGRRQQTSSVKWSTTQQHQQHLSHQHFKTDTATATTTNNLLRQHYLNQTVRKQKSFIEKGQLMNKTLLSSHTERSYLSRGLSVGRSHDIQRSAFSRQLLKKHSIITTQSCNGKNERETLKTGDIIKRNITNCGQGPSCSVEFLRNSRRIQAWSSTSSILKSLDKELAQLNGVVGKCKDVNVLKGRSNIVDNLKVNNPKSDSYTTSSTHIIQQSTKPEINKVNLSIVLSSALNSTTEENYCASHSDQEADDNNDDESDETTSSDSNKIISSHTKSKDNKKSSNLRPTVPTQQKRALYHTSRLGTNLALSSNNITAVNSGLQNPQTFNASPSLTVQKRPPLVRAMSAPVRSFDETSKGSTFLVNKRKSRRRKLNARNISCDKNASDVLHSKDLSIDTKSALNRKVLTRSKSVAPDVITLVSLISSEGSDSEKEDNSITHTNLHKNSPTRRAPSLRKTGKSVSFQENYPPTFQFASKEYSHMLRRGSIAPLAQRIKSNRPPTAPPGSIFHNTHKLTNEMPTTNPEVNEEKENHLKNNKNNDNSSHIAPTANDKNLEDDYEFPHYVRTLKERECWKLYMKMSTKGVNITYDTILRGMLTPTEFRQLQKQREIEEAKALKEAEGNGLLEEKTKGSPTAIERLKESLLKN